MNGKRFMLNALFTGFLMAAFAVSAADKTWTGEVDNDWNNPANWRGGLPGTGDKAIIATSGASVNVTADTQILTLQIATGAAGVSVNIASGMTLFLSNSGSPVYEGNESASINGPGSLKLSTSTGTNYADWRPASGKTVTINAPIIENGTAGFENNLAGVALLASGASDFTGEVIITATGGIIAFTGIADSGWVCPLGKGSMLIASQANAVYRFIGDTPAFTDRTVELRHTALILEQAGAAPITFSGPARGTTDNGSAKTLVLSGDSAAPATYAGVVGNGTSGNILSLAKRGSGTWTLSGANTATGGLAVDAGTLTLTGQSAFTSVTLNGGALELAHASALPATSPVALAGGTLRFAVAPASLGAVAVTGFAAMDFSALSSSATLPAVTVAAGKRLNIVSSVPVFISGPADGQPLPGIFINGLPASYSSSSGVIPAGGTATAPLAALGPDTIGNTPGTAYTIGAEGTGDGIDLAAGAAAFSITQPTLWPANVKFNAGQTLDAGTLAIGPTAATLTLGAVPGEGAVTASSGALVLKADSPGSPLTLFPSVVDSAPGVPLGIVKDGPGESVLHAPAFNGTASIYGGTLALTIGTGETFALSGVSGAGTLAKAGQGTMLLTNASPAFAGPVVVGGGTLSVGVSDGAGVSAAYRTVTVLDRGAIDVGAAKSADALTLRQQFVITGDGPDDKGALVNSSRTFGQNTAFQKVTLAGGASVGGHQRLDIRPTGTDVGWLDLAGHTLTKLSTNYFAIINLPVTPDDPAAAGRHGGIDLEGGTLSIEGSADFAGSADNILNVASGSLLMLYNLTPNPINWTVNAAAGATIRAGNAVSDVHNRFAGPVNLCGPGDTILNQINTSQINFEGKISGAGGLAQASGSFRLMAPVNDYAGNTTVSNKDTTLYAAFANSLPGKGVERVSVKNEAILSIPLADTSAEGWTIAEAGGLVTGSAFAVSNSVLKVDTSRLSSPVTEFPYPVNSGLFKVGAGSLALKAPVWSGFNFIADEGVLDVQDPGPHFVGYMRSYAGSFVFTNDAVFSTVGTANQHCYLADRVGVGSLSNRIGGTTSFAVSEKGYNTSSSKFYIGQNGIAVLDVTDNAYAEGPLQMGNTASAVGAVYQSGDSVFVNTAGAGNDGRIGLNGYGHYWLESGTFTNKGYTQIGYGKGSYGMFRQTGGTFVRVGGSTPAAGTVSLYYGGHLTAARNGSGALMFLGGEAFYDGGSWSVNSDGNYDPDPAYSVFTVGSNAYVRVNSGVVEIGRLTNANSVALINFEGDGVLHTRRINVQPQNSKKYINFNGGTFRVHAGETANMSLCDYTGINQPTRTTLYGAGATFEVPEGLFRTVDIPLSAPSGRGLVDTEFATPLTGYVAPPFPVIRGNGQGGTAGYVDPVFDRATGAVTGFRAISPGFDYPNNDIAIILKGGGMADATATVKTASGKFGGITKTGGGSLRLTNPTNTYSGVTRVLNGEIILGNLSAIPSASHVEIGGAGSPASLNLNGLAFTNAGVTLKDGATVINGTLAAASIRKVGSGRATLATEVSLGSYPADGTLQPGFQEGMLRVAWSDNACNPGGSVQLTTAAGNGMKTNNNLVADGRWAGNNHTWIYTGYIWNRGLTEATWTFRSSFDDNVSLWIDNEISAALSGTVASKPITLAPGPHLFRIYFGDGAGSVGNNHNGVSGLEIDTGDGAGWRALADSGDGNFITVSKEPWGPFWRTLQCTPSQPGLWEGTVSNARNTVDPNPCDAIQQTTRAANGTCGQDGTINGYKWTNDTMIVYSGYIWNHENHDVTWTFIEDFDDTAVLMIDDNAVLCDGGSGTTTRNRVTLTPGVHSFEARFGQRGGTAGLSNTRPSWWPAVADGGKGAFLVDFEGRLDDDIGNYSILENPATGLPILTTGPALPRDNMGTAVVIEDGVLALGALPGLFEGMIPSAWDDTSRNPSSSAQLTTRAGNIPKVHNTTSGLPEVNYFWAGNNHTWVYTGYLWNHSDAPVTWTFWATFDDHASLHIRGKEVLYDKNSAGVRADVTLYPGANAIEIRFADGSGNVGPNTAGLPGGLSYSTVIGSTNPADYKLLVDPGDGSLLTTLLPLDYSGLSVDIAGPGTLDLCGNTNNVGRIMGSGAITNGILAANTILSPAGDAAAGELTLRDVTFAAGVTYRVTVDGAQSDKLVLSGVADLSNLTIVPAMTGMEFTGSSYVIAQTTGDFTGAKPTLSGFDRKWSLIRKGTELILTSANGTMLILK